MKAAEPIAGYTLKECIGAGGYGEVWEVEAPGGLTKAMKFVFGRFGEERAVCELKALNRIKEVRHPFLLSLERIEVVDGQLVIVTELADESLKDRFQQCRETGSPGIPRDQLLVYLGDAADALDHIREHYSLQHLDVKPENLLIVGGRVKVADFGLVKDIHDATVSLMGGLTPVYASPEVYDGRPGLHSDQYSLAVVYQELLTGVLPFPGRTPAQLASQHLNSRPRLGPLPETDRSIIARALAKAPDGRFPSCRALIEALRDPASIARSPGALPEKELPGETEPPADTTTVAKQMTHSGMPPECSRSADSPAVSVPGPTESFAAPNPRPPEAVASIVQTESTDEPPSREAPPCDVPREPRRSALPAASPAVIDLAPIDVEASEARFRPTLFLGIGATGARTLRRLRGRLHERFGAAENIPALRMLLVDTDAKALSEATKGDHTKALDYDDTIAVPLRPAQDYRADSKKHLNWLSRRWLYNIPRSLQTEGIRPLGRLAMVDHAKQLFGRIRSALASIAAPDALERSAGATGLEMAGDEPRVFVISSISGGTGSGMVLDLGYAVRMLLAELGHPDEGVCGILAHSAPRHPDAKKLAAANALACLSELGHFARAGEYPGDPACRLPAFRETPAPFHATYVVHLGEDLDEAEFAAATDRLAEYLYLNAVTTATAFFDACRATPPANEAGLPVGVRTFGLRQAGRAQSDLLRPISKLLCKRVVQHWSDEPDDPPHEGDEISGARFHRARHVENVPHDKTPILDGPALANFVEETIRRETGDDRDACFRRLFARHFELREGRPENPHGAPGAEGLLQVLHSFLGTCRQSDDALQLSPGSLQSAVRESLKRTASERSTAVRQWVVHLVDAPEAGILAACRAVDSLAEGLRRTEADTLAAVLQLNRRLAEMQRPLEAARPSEYDQLAAWSEAATAGRRTPKLALRWLEYCGCRLQQAVLLEVCHLLQSVLGTLSAIDRQLGDLRGELGHLADRFKVPDSWSRRPSVDPAAPPGDRQKASIAGELWDRLPSMAEQLDQQLRAGLLAENGGLCGLLKDEGDLRKRLLTTLDRAARGAAARALNEINLAGMLTGSDSASSGVLHDCIEHATPRLLQCGGARRILAVCPEGLDPAVLGEAVRTGCGIVPTTLGDPGADLVLCHEVARVPLDNVAASLVENHDDVARIATRLRTRVDVTWTPS